MQRDVVAHKVVDDAPVKTMKLLLGQLWKMLRKLRDHHTAIQSGSLFGLHKEHEICRLFDKVSSLERTLFNRKLKLRIFHRLRLRPMRTS